MSHWLKNNKLVLNISKTKSLIFGSTSKNAYWWPAVRSVRNIKEQAKKPPNYWLWRWMDTWMELLIRMISTYLTVLAYLSQCCTEIWTAASKKDINKLQTLHCSNRTNVVYVHTRLMFNQTKPNTKHEEQTHHHPPTPTPCFFLVHCICNLLILLLQISNEMTKYKHTLLVLIP